MAKLKDIPNQELIRFLGVNDSQASQIKSGRPVSWRRAQAISEKFDVPLYEIRPDIYPKEIFKDKAG